MPNELQAAIDEGVAELSSSAGESFVYASQSFTAWPVLAFTETPGRLESNPETVKTYEAKRSTTPAFVRGAALTVGGAACRVGEVHRTDPTTGLFRFSIT